MLTYETISKNYNHLDRIKALYNRAFPKNERYPFSALIEQDDYTDFLAFYDNDQFVGFLAMLHVGDLYHIIYFAVPETLRKQGYGSRILQTVHTNWSDKHFVVDIEQPVVDSPSDDYRVIRKNFYLQNGYEETIKKYIWLEEHYEVLIHNGTFDQNEWSHFWNTLYANKDSIF